MAKHNDMPELNSAKVFLANFLTAYLTLIKLFTPFLIKAPAKLSCQHPVSYTQILLVKLS